MRLTSSSGMCNSAAKCTADCAAEGVTREFILAFCNNGADEPIEVEECHFVVVLSSAASCTSLSNRMRERPF